MPRVPNGAGEMQSPGIDSLEARLEGWSGSQYHRKMGRQKIAGDSGIFVFDGAAVVWEFCF
jgi:hypothetical protein